MAEAKTQNRIYEAKISKRLEKIIKLLDINEEQARILLQANLQIKEKKNNKRAHISGYNLYAQEVFETSKAEFSNNTNAENWAIIGLMWKKLTDDEKDTYNNRAVNIQPKVKKLGKGKDSVGKELKKIFK